VKVRGFLAVPPLPIGRQVEKTGGLVKQLGFDDGIGKRFGCVLEKWLVWDDTSATLGVSEMVRGFLDALRLEMTGGLVQPIGFV